MCAHQSSEARLEESLNTIAQTGKEFATKATILSQQIEYICDRLCSTPGLMEYKATGENCNVGLERVSGGWFVYVESTAGKWRLTQAPVMMKARALPVLLTLIAELENYQLEQLEIVEGSLALLPSGSLVDTSTKEGK